VKLRTREKTALLVGEDVIFTTNSRLAAGRSRRKQILAVVGLVIGPVIEG
jgi:hypothetical protein